MRKDPGEFHPCFGSLRIQKRTFSGEEETKRTSLRNSIFFCFFNSFLDFSLSSFLFLLAKHLKKEKERDKDGKKGKMKRERESKRGREWNRKYENSKE